MRSDYQKKLFQFLRGGKESEQSIQRNKCTGKMAEVAVLPKELQQGRPRRWLRWRTALGGSGLFPSTLVWVLGSIDLAHRVNGEWRRGDRSEKQDNVPGTHWLHENKRFSIGKPLVSWLSSIPKETWHGNQESPNNCERRPWERKLTNEKEKILLK